MPKKQARKWKNGVRLTKSGRYEWQVMVNYQPFYGTADTETEAKAQREAAKKLAPTYSPQMTIPQLGDAWYKDRLRYVKMTGEGAEEINEREGRYLEESSYTSDGNTLARVKRAFPDDEIGYTSPKRIYDGIMGLMKLDGGRYYFGAYQDMRRVLTQMYYWAEMDKIITETQNPMYKLPDLHDTKQKKAAADSFDTAEVRAILDWVDEHDALLNERDRKWSYSLAVGVVAGYRSEEAVMLMEPDIEPDGSAIQIDKASKRGEKGRMYKGGPKSDTGERLTELPELVWRYAKWLREHAENEYVYYSPKTYLQSVKKELKGNDFVCWIHPSTYAYNVRRILNKIDGVRKLTAHKAQRHTKITLDNTAQVDRRVGMAQSGHSDERVYRGYDHVHRQEKKAAAAKVNELLKNKQDNEEK